jgi:hypothetical protein
MLLNSLKSFSSKNRQVAIITSLLLVSASAHAADLTPGYYKVWTRPTETATADMSALMRKNPTIAFCVTPAMASNPLVTTGVRPDDAPCTASRPNKVNATTETFTLSCPQTQTTGNARMTRQGDTFVTVIDWQGNGSAQKSVVTGVRIEGCVK